MGWLSKLEPLFLYQESDIPYVVLNNGVLLCFNNLYSTAKVKSTEYDLCFSYNKNDIAKQSANYLKIKSFPVLIDFSNVASVNGISDFRTIKTSSYEIPCEEQSISIIRGGYINRLSRDDTYDILDSFDRNFILISEDIPSNIRNIDNVSPILHKNSDWGRTCVSIADQMSSTFNRKNIWTNSVPPLDISCYGLRETEYLDLINSFFADMGISVSTKWEI